MRRRGEGWIDRVISRIMASSEKVLRGTVIRTAVTPGHLSIWRVYRTDLSTVECKGFGARRTDIASDLGRRAEIRDGPLLRRRRFSAESRRLVRRLSGR